LLRCHPLTPSGGKGIIQTRPGRGVGVIFQKKIGTKKKKGEDLHRNFNGRTEKKKSFSFLGKLPRNTEKAKQVFPTRTLSGGGPLYAGKKGGSTKNLHVAAGGEKTAGGQGRGGRLQIHCAFKGGLVYLKSIRARGERKRHSLVKPPGGRT